MSTHTKRGSEEIWQFSEWSEIRDIAVDELTGSVENYAAFFDALKELSPVPIAFENITDGAKGYFSHVENRIAIQEGTQIS